MRNVSLEVVLWNRIWWFHSGKFKLYYCCQQILFCKCVFIQGHFFLIRTFISINLHISVEFRWNIFLIRVEMSLGLDLSVTFLIGLALSGVPFSLSWIGAAIAVWIWFVLSEFVSGFLLGGFLAGNVCLLCKNLSI